VSEIFKELSAEAFKAGITPKTKESIKWFTQKAKALGKITKRNQLMREEEVELRSRFLPGQMVMYFYDPKLKDVLPYYDRFPLTIIIDKAPGGFYGLNLHYLPPLLRGKLLDSLINDTPTNNQKNDETTRLELNYQKLKTAAKYKFFKPAFKHYLTDHVRSKFALVSPPEWEIAAFLPMADWGKGSQGKVWRDSRSMI
jgi:hypothetical protein